MSLHDALFLLQDPQYQQFQQKLIPNISPETILGVRTPQLRKIARDLEDPHLFLRSLPHRYFEENQVHCFCIEGEKDFLRAVALVEAFLPFVDNWATCDQLRPRIFHKHRQELLPYIETWMKSDHVYTVRFGIEMLMCHFLEEDFDCKYLGWVAAVRQEDYYVKMMIAWYFATALAKQYDASVPYIIQRRLDHWIHKKAIQKALESYRITPEQKEFLKQYR